MYVGSAIGPRKLAQRLAEHKRRIENAQNISITEMTCRLLPVDEDWMATAAERMMIDRYQPEWQGSGFGGHAPGGGRPGKRPREWDARFPPKGNMKRR